MAQPAPGGAIGLAETFNRTFRAQRLFQNKLEWFPMHLSD